jgi:hypothetical protein
MLIVFFYGANIRGNTAFISRASSESLSIRSIAGGELTKGHPPIMSIEPR